MADYRLPWIKELPALPVDVQNEAFDHLFEPCETLKTLVLSSVLVKESSFQSYGQLIEQIRSALLNLVTESADSRVKKIIASHPRLGAAKTIRLSSHSQAEQASLQASSEFQAQRLKELNDQYEATFPGLRYVVFVNGRSRDVIMKNMIKRIERRDIEKEKHEAFNVSNNT